ncbi:MAG TPA: protein kinase, partial [Thermoanaerobaculia bacterium]|nr:protein kinase [Thermoanaerobaculia bacterium]
EDRVLQRLVALKIVRRSEENQEPVDRFLREARAASAINHPSVAHIYEIGHRDDLVFIAMEYVEGITLETRLQREGALPIDEASRLALQIADPLVAAHARGIIHRDLKPANIMITSRDQVKILDFGLAKFTGVGATPQKHTAPGTVLGTVPYMSPEQLGRHELDARSDLFSFGVILYEMIEGKRPFDGETFLETLRNVAEIDPPAMRSEIPGSLREIVMKCLEKEPDRRFNSAEDLVSALRQLPSMGDQGGWSPAKRPPAQWRSSAVAASVAAVALIVVLAIGLITDWGRRGHPSPDPTYRVTRLTSAPGLEDEPAISPDGRMLAYTSDERGNLDIYIRPIDGGDAVRLTDRDADDAQPAWSPDGKRIAFVSSRENEGRLSIVLGQALGNFINAQGGDLFVVPAEGGEAALLAEDAFYPSWSPDGRWIAFQSSRGGTWDLWKIAVDGGEPVPLTDDLAFDYQPAWSPDGKWIVCGSGMPEPYRLRVVSADGKTSRSITDGADRVLLRPVFAPDGRSIIYSSMRGGSLNLWRLPLRSATEPAGEPSRLTLGVGDDVHAAVAADGNRIVYASVRQMPDLWTLDPRTGETAPVTSETGAEEFPHRSTRGSLVFSSDRDGGSGIWVLEPDGGLTRVAARPNAGQPRWSPDGKRLAYRFQEEGTNWVVIQEPGSAELRKIHSHAEAPAWSPDGKWLAFTSWKDRRKSQIHIAPSAGGAVRRVTDLDLSTSYPSWSPDGARISFQATRDDGTRHVWVSDLRSGETRPLTSGDSEDSHPQWSPVDPDRILFVRSHENLMVVRVSTGEIEPLTHFRDPNTILDYPSWSADGERIDFSLARRRGDLYLLERE